MADYLVYDASIVRGLDYYTGPVFEAYDRAGKFRAIFGGGRYDNLVADVGGDRITGVGFAMGDVIIELLLERAGKRPDLPTSPSRRAGHPVRRRAVSPDRWPWLPGCGRPASTPSSSWSRIAWASRFRYADRKGIPYVAILGPDELDAGQVVLKNLLSGEQQALPEEEAIQALKASLSGPGQNGT